MQRPLDVLLEDNHCLAVNKPARLLTAGDETGDETLLQWGRDYIKEKYGKPGSVFLGLVHRLDRPVSGAVLFARTSKAAARLSEQFRLGRVKKVYHALVEGTVPSPGAELTDWLIKDAAKNLVRAVPAGTRGAQECVLAYRRLSSAGGLTLLEVMPRTGRSHQIRVQLANLGAPVFGDAKYGAAHRFHGAIALHAAQLTFEHPIRHEPVVIEAPRPASWAAITCGLR